MIGSDLEKTSIHLGLGARAVTEPPITGLDWYAGYVARHADDGVEGRLVSLFRFDVAHGRRRSARKRALHHRRRRHRAPPPL